MGNNTTREDKKINSPQQKTGVSEKDALHLSTNFEDADRPQSFSIGQTRSSTFKAKSVLESMAASSQKSNKKSPIMQKVKKRCEGFDGTQCKLEILQKIEEKLAQTEKSSIIALRVANFGKVYKEFIGKMDNESIGRIVSNLLWCLGEHTLSTDSPDIQKQLLNMFLRVDELCILKKEKISPTEPGSGKKQAQSLVFGQVSVFKELVNYWVGAYALDIVTHIFNFGSDLAVDQGMMDDKLLFRIKMPQRITPIVKKSLSEALQGRQTYKIRYITDPNNRLGTRYSNKMLANIKNLQSEWMEIIRIIVSCIYHTFVVIFDRMGLDSGKAEDHIAMKEIITRFLFSRGSNFMSMFLYMDRAMNHTVFTNFEEKRLGLAKMSPNQIIPSETRLKMKKEQNPSLVLSAHSGEENRGPATPTSGRSLRNITIQSGSRGSDRGSHPPPLKNTLSFSGVPTTAKFLPSVRRTPAIRPLLHCLATAQYIKSFEDVVSSIKILAESIFNLVDKDLHYLLSWLEVFEAWLEHIYGKGVLTDTEVIYHFDLVIKYLPNHEILSFAFALEKLLRKKTMETKIYHVLFISLTTPINTFQQPSQEEACWLSPPTPARELPVAIDLLSPETGNEDGSNGLSPMTPYSCLVPSYGLQFPSTPPLFAIQLRQCKNNQYRKDAGASCFIEDRKISKDIGDLESPGSPMKRHTWIFDDIQ